MNNLTAVLNRRFTDFSKKITHKNDHPKPKEVTPSETTDHDESIKWCPATEFFEFESPNCHSFVLPDCESATDGESFKRVVEELSNLLETHVRQADQLISANAKFAKIPENIEETLRVAIGRTKLLMDKRMKQFKEQLDRHLNPIAGQKVTKLDDLHGLWALIEFSLNDIRNCFEIVENSRLNGWNAQNDVLKEIF